MTAMLTLVANYLLYTESFAESSQFRAGGYLDIKVTNLAPRLILRVRLRAEALKIQPCRSNRKRI